MRNKKIKDNDFVIVHEGEQSDFTWAGDERGDPSEITLSAYKADTYYIICGDFFFFLSNDDIEFLTLSQLGNAAHWSWVEQTCMICHNRSTSI